MQKWVIVAAAIAFAACGSGGPTVPPPVPSTTLAAQPSPSPTAQPTASPTAGTQACTFEPGPVARLAISPREQRSDGAEADVRVRVLPDFDEVWCLDRDKSHRLDLNANQRNADGRESCYLGKVAWTIDDPRQLVVSTSSRHQDNFIYRLNVEPRGLSTSFEIEAELDGIKSFPWQSASGFRREPLRIVTMSANQMGRECTCIFRGNGVYEGGPTCPRAPSAAISKTF